MTSGPITLYVPARNAQHTLGDCLAAVQAQTRPPDELFIIVDPRSRDATEQIARDSGLKVIKQTGTTLGATRNEAILAAQHRWIACCDSDVVVQPDWLEKLAARRAEGLAGIGGRTLERTLNPFDAWRALHLPHHWGEHAFRNPFMLVSEVLFDREALLAVGGYRDDLNYYEDSDLCQRLREGGYDLLYEPAAFAEHRRTDTLLSVLTLRWNYSEYRQRHLLDRYAGLAEKLRVNREYALNTLARSLARGREELAYISFLLFFHHVIADLAALLARRPLISPEGRAAMQRQLLEAAFTSARGWSSTLAGRMRADLEPMFGKADAPERPAKLTRGGIDHLDCVRRAVEAFGRGLPELLWSLLEASAEHCCGRRPAEVVPRLERPATEELQHTLDQMPVNAFIDAGFRGEIVRHWPDTQGIHVIGPARASEHKALRTRQAAASDPSIVEVVAHLESRADPLGVFRDIPSQARRLVICYQAPARFVPGLDVVTPADLASAASTAGWTITRFDTFVGRVRLILSRAAL